MKKNRNLKIDTDPDFIVSPKHGNSLKRLLSNNPNGISDGTICKVLKLSQEEVDKAYASAILKLRKVMGNDDKDE